MNLTPAQVKRLSKAVSTLDADTRKALNEVLDRAERARVTENVTARMKAAASRQITESAPAAGGSVMSLERLTQLISGIGETAPAPEPSPPPIETPLHKLSVEQLREVHRGVLDAQAAGGRTPFWAAGAPNAGQNPPRSFWDGLETPLRPQGATPEQS